MPKFNVTDILNQKSKADITEETVRFTIRDIPISKIQPSEDNQYGMRDIEKLAANIESLGLLHNLVVKSEDSNGFYEIISGERRYRACKMLFENGNEKFRYLPCKVEKAEQGEISELKLIYANATARELTDFEKSNQAARIKELLYKLKENGYEFTGRMNEIASEILGISPAQVKRMEKINKNLSNDFKEELKAGNIGITAAYDVSTLSEDEQIDALEEFKNTGQVDAQSHKRRRTLQNVPTKAQRTVKTLFEQAGINFYTDEGKVRDPADFGRDIYKFLEILE